MDEAVLKALAKWPDVPNVFGWLSLDRRGNWLIKGDPIDNEAVRSFIGRNYLADAGGRWFFQNGPQRVFVQLHYTPYVLRTFNQPDGSVSLTTHNDIMVDNVTGAWLDEDGNVLLRSQLGIGCVCDRDLAQVINWLSDAAGVRLDDDELERVIDAPTGRGNTGWWFNYRSKRSPVGRLHTGQVAAKFGFEPEPRPLPGQPDC